MPRRGARVSPRNTMCVHPRHCSFRLLVIMLLGALLAFQSRSNGLQDTMQTNIIDAFVGMTLQSRPVSARYRIRSTATDPAMSGEEAATATAAPATAAAAKHELLASIAHFKTVQARDGTAAVDFGVSGGELEKKSRAPRNLASDGTFYRISTDLGKAADRVIELANKLGPFSPEAPPLEHFGTPRGAECLLHGTWKLQFTTAADATFSRNTSRGDAEVSNIVDAIRGIVTNCIDFKASPDDDVPACEQLRVRLSASAESGSRVALVFRLVKARLTRFFGLSLGRRRLTLTLPVPGPLISRIISFFTRRPPPKPYFDIIYLDHELRVHRTGEGNLFVQKKAETNMLA